MTKWQEVLGLIVQDMAADVTRFDGAPLDGKTVAEMHANLAAAVSALAEIMLAVLPEA
jgi:hypothetical protein